MTTALFLIGSIERKLGYPSAPNQGVIGEFLVETIDEKVTDLNLSRVPWFLAKATIDVSPGESVYSLDSAAPGLDKPRYLYTVDDTQPAYCRRPVDLVDYESLTTYYRGGDMSNQAIANLPYYNYERHSAIAASVYFDARRGNVIEFAPVPNQAASYVLVYEVATMRPQSKDSEAWRFEQFNGYVSDSAALKILAHCEWKGMQPQEFPAKRASIAGGPAQGYGLVVDVAKGDRRFWMWKHSGKNPSGLTSVPFGRDFQRR